MIKRIFIIALITLLNIACSGDNSSDQKQNYHIGILAGVDVFDPTIDGFKDQMTRFGYEEGRNIEYTVGRAKGVAAEMDRLAKEFVQSKVDLIFTITNGAALAAKEATSESQTPVVFAITLAPVASGVVDSLTNPAGNLTGVRNPLGEFIGKRIELLKQLVPDTQSVLIFNNPNYPTIPFAKKGLYAAANQLNIELIDIPIASTKDMADYLNEKTNKRIDAILIMPDNVVQREANMKLLFQFANSRSIPIVANTPGQVTDGALFSYHSDSYQSGQQAALLTSKVLSGATPNVQPIISSEPNLVLNLSTAKKLNLSVDPSILSLADGLIE